MTPPARRAIDLEVRKCVFDHFLEHGQPPVVEEIELHVRQPRAEVEAALDRLEGSRHLKLVPRTHRILMAFPFSAVATPYRVTVEGQGSYFANCAWDAVAFHSMLRRPIQVDSFCRHCGTRLAVAIREGKRVGDPENAPVVYLGLPAAQWWDDILYSCGNTMVFFGSHDHLERWRSQGSMAEGQELSIETTLKLSEPLYASKMDRDYARPSREALERTFAELGLRGAFWKL